MKKALSLFVFVLLWLAAPVYAADIVKPENNNPNVVIGAKESYKNLYTAGGQVIIDSETKGDLTVAGGMVSVNGNVEQAALIAGGNLNVTGNVGGTMRIAGGNINISGGVGGDLVSAGGNLTISSKSQVGGDLVIVGGNITVDAPVLGNVKIGGDSVTINSKISGNVEIMTSKQLAFGPNAEIAGTINYKGPQAAAINSSAKISEINFTKVEIKNVKPALAGLVTLAFLIKLCAWLIAAWIIVRFKKNFIVRLNQEVSFTPWENLGIGFLALVSTPIAIIILFVTLVGYYLAILVGLSYLLLLSSAALLSSVVLGYYLLAKITKSMDTPKDWQAILLGVVSWMLLAFIPVVGWLTMFIIFLMTLGAGVKLLKRGNVVS